MIAQVLQQQVVQGRLWVRLQCKNTDIGDTASGWVRQSLSPRLLPPDWWKEADLPFSVMPACMGLSDVMLPAMLLYHTSVKLLMQRASIGKISFGGWVPARAAMIIRDLPSTILLLQPQPAAMAANDGISLEQKCQEFASMYETEVQVTDDVGL